MQAFADVGFRIVVLASMAMVGCAATSAGRRWDELSAREHGQAAAREQRLADEEFVGIRPEAIRSNSLDAEGPALFLGPASFDASSDPTEPEFYIRDPSIDDPSERHQEAARQHRERAERHEAAARRALRRE